MKKDGKIDRGALREKAKKRIIMVAAIGAILAIADIAVSQSNTDVRLVSAEQGLYMTRPSAEVGTGHLSLRARIEGEEGIVEKTVAVRLEPYGSAESEDAEEAEETEELSEEERIDQELRSIVNSFNSDSSVKQVKLPDKLESGEKVSWSEDGGNNAVPILAVTMLVMGIIYKTRFDSLVRQKKLQQESVIRQLPEFVNRLVLLLNAGLVLNSAFERSVEESVNQKKSDEDYFYAKMHEIYIAVKKANGSMHVELRRFAKESGIKELMRVSNIISDNVSKGVALTQKLQVESEILWMQRKKNCEERGKLTETKLTLPLMIFLMVLITITIAPAMLEL